MFLGNEFFIKWKAFANGSKATKLMFVQFSTWCWVLTFYLLTANLALAAESAPKQHLIVGSELDFPPFALVREGGVADGFTAELWRAVAREAHLDATIKTGPFHEILEQFKNGQIDVLINLAQSDERRRFADFSVPHVRMSGAIFVRRGESRIRSENDLAGKSLIVINADLAHDYALMRGWTKLTLADTVANGMKLLASSTRHDAMLVGRLVGLNTTKELKLDNVQALQVKLQFHQDFAFAVRKGNSELLARINDGLASVRAGGAYDAIYAKWFSRLELEPLTMESILKYMVPALAVILLLTLAYLRERSLRMRWKDTATALDASISERKRAEEELREARDELELRVAERTSELTRSNALLRQKEEQLALAQRGGHTGLWNRDLTTGVDATSAEWKDLMGFPLNQERVGYAEFLARIHPDDRARMQSRTSTLTDGDFEAEFRIEHPEKGERWILSRGRRGISSEDGHLHMMGALIDVTARKRAEEKLTATKNLLQKVMDSSPDWIFAKDLDYRFLFVNRAFAEAQSLTPDDMIGRFDTEYWSEELCEGNPEKAIRGFHEDDRAAFRGEAVHNPADPATFSDGSLHIFDTFKSPMRDEAGRIFGALCYCRDTTERKQAEEALRESEARLRAILDHHPAPVFIKDNAGRYVHVNRRFEELFGLDDAKSLGKTDAELFASEQAKAFQRNDRKVLDLGHAIQFEEVAQYYDGEHTSIVNKFPLRDGQGKVYGLCGIATDITECKRAEEALRKLTDDLDRRVVERTRELAESQARLRALVAQLSRAEERERRRLAVELHDYLAQMLTISRLNIGRADKLAADDALKKRLAEALESVDDSIAYTRSLMAQLSPRMLYDLGLPAALAWLGAQQKERHGLDVDLSGEAEDFALDEERSVLTYQCVRELLWNIVKHAETNQATVSYALEDGELTIEVADDGRGFDPERLHGNGNDLAKFGLFSIRERLELFGGKLEVTSQPGRGTRARFTLPAPQSEIAPLVAHGPSPASIMAMATDKLLSVVLVDDHEVVRRGLRQLLEEFADLMVVGEAKDGLAGIELARQFRPDVVVMDVNMPGMNGIEATRLIRQEMPSTIVVGLSFASGAEVAQAMKAAGAFTCVTKERAAEDIHQVIMDAMEERRGVTAY